jgi:hypothetical protein
MLSLVTARRTVETGRREVTEGTTRADSRGSNRRLEHDMTKLIGKSLVSAFVVHL